MESLASKYAYAIVSIAKEENKCEEYKNALIMLLDVFRNEIETAKFLESYFISNEEKYKVIDESLRSINLPNFTNFIKLLTEKHLISKYKDIVKEAIVLLNESLNIDDGFVYSTSKLSEEKMNEIELVISKKLNQKVELKNIIDPRLIGGIKVVVHDHVFDGSIKHKIENLKENLKERRTA